MRSRADQQVYSILLNPCQDCCKDKHRTQATPTKCNIFRQKLLLATLGKQFVLSGISKSYAVNLVVLVVLFSNALVNIL